MRKRPCWARIDILRYDEIYITTEGAICDLRGPVQMRSRKREFDGAFQAKITGQIGVGRPARCEIYASLASEVDFFL